MSATAMSNRAAATITATGARVLVVDADGVVRAGLRTLLERHGFEVALEASAEAALRRMRSFAADVVLLDADLPDLSGVEVTRRLAQQAPTASVVLLTVAIDDARALEAVRTGVSGLLLREAEIDDIIAAVRAVAAGHAAIAPRLAGALIAALRTAAASTEPRPEPAGVALSAHERRLLELVTEGLDNAAIGRQLFISTNTVKRHLSRLLTKLGVDNRVHAATYAVRHGVLASEHRTAA